MGRILVVDDEQSMRDFMQICLSRAGHEVSCAENGQAALEQLQKDIPDVVVTDLRMPGEVDGLGVLHSVKANSWPCEVIMVTAYASPETAIEAMKAGAYDYLTKPFKVDEISAVIGRALERRDLVNKNQALTEHIESRYRLGSIIGTSPAMQRVFELVRKVASTTSSVLVTGESGTGKELIARAIHAESDRNSSPFVAVNCGAIPAELMESELFGHEKGAFTGATGQKLGLFRSAEGGTIFLDEIGELPSSLQVKLLRVLQERSVKAVGAESEVNVDVRVVAATNRELEDEVESGAFRQDLYYRLNVIEVRLPPLRRRQEDIALLASHFAERFAKTAGKSVELSTDAHDALQAYDFPGNVRELENIVERAVALVGESGRISADDLPALKPRRKQRVGADIELPMDLEQVLSDIEAKIVTRALHEAGGKRKKAAEMLGISMRSLRYKLSKLSIED